MESILEQLSNRHHGHLLKAFIIEKGINKKGGINQLAKALGLTRQGIYVLYDQEVIKKEYRDILAHQLQLPVDFFPEPISLIKRFEQLKEKYVKVRLINLDLREELLAAKEKNLSRLYLQTLHHNNAINQIDNLIKLVTRKYTYDYVHNHYKIEFLDNLPTIKLPFIASGFAFQIKGNSMKENQIYDEDILICNELLEDKNDIKSNTPYIIVFAKSYKEADVICRYITINNNSYYLKATNVQTPDLYLNSNQVKEIWKVTGKYTSNVSINS